MKLAEALLLRKELQAKVDRLKAINTENLFEFKMQRLPVGDGIDDIKAQVPKISFQQFTHCYDWHAKQLRKVDAAIQQANWNTDVENVDDVAQDYVDPYVDVKK
jgi:hypothetical protein